MTCLVIAVVLIFAHRATIPTIIARTTHSAAKEAFAHLEALLGNGGGVILIRSSISGVTYYTSYTSRMPMILDQWSSTVTLPVAVVCTMNRSTTDTMPVLVPTNKGNGAVQTILLRALLPSGRLVMMAETIAPTTAEVEGGEEKLAHRLHSPQRNIIKTSISTTVLISMST